MRGLAACGASALQKVRFALWPQVKPIFLSYGFMRLEINFRSSTILGLVGAGGIGQELMTNIKLDRYDQVSMTLLLAATASLTWLLMAPMAALPSGFIGNIWWLAAGLLVAGSWLGLRGASRWLAKLPDRWHVRIYPLLLLLVLLAMCFGGVG